MITRFAEACHVPSSPQEPGGGGLLDTDGFPPRWFCGSWSSVHGWVHIVADFVTFGAYVMIPFGLVWFLRSRPDLPFKRLFWLFGAFIVLCGLTHLLEAVIFWWPAYRLLGLVKVLTAIVSIVTVGALLPAIPKAIRLPSPSQLREALAEREAAEAKVKEQVEELQRTNIELDRFAYAASHDLKSPLRAIGALASFVVEDMEGSVSPAAAGHLAQLQDRTKRLQSMLSDLLDYARASKLAHGVEEFETGELVREAASLLASDQQFRVEVADDLPTIRGQRTPMRQVFHNLLANAMSHSDRPDGCVRISWAEVPDDPGMLEFLVADNGPGVPIDERAGAFEMFRRGA
ncbi:MAG: HAMP domain-containing histidine kinase, partial [Planctomycetes bacterium]|nr:HAMP domain-containing histidine kinase [Planctomycetota bacterium]